MYRVFRYNGVPTYWPAIATIYVDYPNGSVEEYITDKNGRPKLVGGSSSGGSSFSQAITDGLNGADSPSASNPFATIADINSGSFAYPGAGIPLSTGSAWGISIVNNSSNWNTAFGWGNHASAGYLTSFTETDPVFSASDAANIFSTDILKWNTAFSWGDHASAGYLTAGSLTGYATQSWVTSQGYLTANQSISITGQATGSGTTSIAVTLDNSSVISKVLTGYTSGAGTISATDSILQAIQKLNGNFGSYVPYTGATTNIDLGTYYLMTPCLIGGTAVGSNLIYKSTTGIGTTSGIAHQFTGGTNGATIAMTLLNSGLVGIGTIAPTSTLMVRGASASSGNALEVQNATPSTWFWVSNAGITYARGSANGSGSAGTVVDILQLQRAAGSSVFSVNTHGGIACGNTSLNPTSGAFYQYRMDMNFSPSSGNATFSGIHIAPTINQTGGSTGVTVGLYITPNIINAADFRGLEIGPVANQIRLQSGSTNPTVNGAIAYLTTNQRLVINQNTTVREFVTSDATTGAAGSATGTIRVRISGIDYNLLYK